VNVSEPISTYRSEVKEVH